MICSRSHSSSEVLYVFFNPHMFETQRGDRGIYGMTNSTDVT